MSLAKWLRLPSRIAVLLGMGALSATGASPAIAQPDPGNGPTRVPQQSAKNFGEVLIWSEEGRIYLAEAGKPGEELRLGDTFEARHLRQLLEQHGATASARRVLLNRIILVGGGGCGFDRTDTDHSRPVSNPPKNGIAGSGPPKAVNPHQTVPAEKPSAPHNSGTGQDRAKG